MNNATSIFVIDTYQEENGEWRAYRFSPTAGDAKSAETWPTPDNVADAYFNNQITWISV